MYHSARLWLARGPAGLPLDLRRRARGSGLGDEAQLLADHLPLLRGQHRQQALEVLGDRDLGHHNVLRTCVLVARCAALGRGIGIRLRRRHLGDHALRCGPRLLLASNPLQERVVMHGWDVVLDVGVLVEEVARVPELELFHMGPHGGLQPLVRLLLHLQLILALLLPVGEIFLEIRDDLVNVLWVALAQRRHFLLHRSEAPVQVGGTASLLDLGFLHLPQHPVEELDIRLPQLLQREPPLLAVMGHLPNDLVQRHGQDRDQALNGLRDILPGIHSRIQLLLVSCKGFRDPCVQIDGILAARWPVGREDLLVPHAVPLVVDAAAGAVWEEGCFVDVVLLVDEGRRHRRDQRMRLVTEVGDVVSPRRLRRRALELRENGHRGRGGEGAVVGVHVGSDDDLSPLVHMRLQPRQGMLFSGVSAARSADTEAEAVRPAARDDAVSGHRRRPRPQPRGSDGGCRRSERYSPGARKP
mmetsp:Transcript_105559/g.305353  ORF Transcript_105559/g.305353 Transcript_105559/m.305353 type:complete len:471 (-) Transcript_105559:55-1467(-)